MLKSDFFKLRRWATSWLLALSLLFYYTSAMALPSWLGVIPNITLYYSLNESKTAFKLRSVEQGSPLTGQVVANCVLNSDPEKDTCIVKFACVIGVDMTEPGTIIRGYRLTDVQVYNAIMSKVGQEMDIFGGGNCLNAGVKLAVITSASSVVNGFSGYNWGSSTTLDPDPEQNPQCIISNPSLEINYGTVLATSAQGLKASTRLQISCKKRAYIKLSVPSYNSQQGIPLLPDNSLAAMIELNQFPASPGASTDIEAGTSKEIPVTSILKVNAPLVGGTFSGSTVIRLEYF